jgi:hypothetical protein
LINARIVAFEAPIPQRSTKVGEIEREWNYSAGSARFSFPSGKSCLQIAVIIPVRVRINSYYY